MSKKKIFKKSKVLSLKKLSFSDLYAMYAFVSNLNNTTFGKKVQAKSLFRNKLTEVESELYNRVFGVNPFGADKETVIPLELKEVKGQDPIKVISSFDVGSDTNKTFVVAKNIERK